MSRERQGPPSNIARRRAAAQNDGRGAYVERRREIIASAARVFKERGFRGTTLNHVAEALDTDRASLYYYVGSKDELFQDVVTGAVTANLELAVTVRDAELAVPEKLERLIRGLMASYAEYYPMLYVLIQENLSHVAPGHSKWAAEIRRINRRWEQLLIEIIEAGQDEGSLRSAPPAWLVAYSILGMLGWTNRWFNPNDSLVTADEVADVFTQIVLHGVATQDD